MWSVTNYFLFNLTVSDILMAVFSILSFTYMRDRWPLFHIKYGSDCSGDWDCCVRPLNHKNNLELHSFYWRFRASLKHLKQTNNQLISVLLLHFSGESATPRCFISCNDRVQHTWNQLMMRFHSAKLICRVWIFGGVLCRVNNFVALLTVSLSVFTLLAISLDRRKVSDAWLSSSKFLSYHQLIPRKLWD